jgi:hypothetical protein
MDATALDTLQFDLILALLEQCVRASEEMILTPGGSVVGFLDPS